MQFVHNKFVIFPVMFVFVLYAAHFPAYGGETLVAGKPTAGEAASWRAAQQDTNRTKDLPIDSPDFLTPAYIPSDTTLFEFPEEENEHLIRDITVFVIVAAFVGYFLIKVFLEGDTEDKPEEKPGKDVPGGG